MEKRPTKRQIQGMLVGLRALSLPDGQEIIAGPHGSPHTSSVGSLEKQERLPRVVAPQTPRLKTKRRGGPTEAAEQAALVNWARERGYLIFSIPNGGKRSAWAGAKEKALGLLAGAADLFLAEPRGGYGGYFIEMKAPGKKPRPNQLEFMDLVRARNFKAEWFDNVYTAKLSIELYMAN